MKVEMAKAGDLVIINLRTPVDGQDKVVGYIQYVSDYGITMKNGLSIPHSNINSISKLVIEPNVIPPVKAMAID